MGLLKHKGQKKQQFFFALHCHTLSWRADEGPLCITYERGSSHRGSTRQAVPSPRQGGAGATYAFEEQVDVPATLYQDAASARKASGKGPGPFLPKELCLLITKADTGGKPTGQLLGRVTLNLADYAAADGRTQQAFAVAPAGGRLLLTIGCRDSSKGGAPLVLEPSLSSAEMEAGEEEHGLPTSMSTDDEGGSRSTSAAGGYSRPGSSLAARGAAGLGAVPEERLSARASPRHGSKASLRASPRASPRGSPRAASRNGWGAQQAAAAAGVAGGLAAAAGGPPVHAAAAEQAAQAGAGRYDEDGFLLDDEEGETSQEMSASVRRNLGSAMEKAEASDGASQRGAGEASSAAAEVQSGPAAPVPQSTFARLRSGGFGGAAAAGSPPAPPADAGQPLATTPRAESTDQQSSILSASGDPAVPFSVPPSTSRRFAQRDSTAAAGAAGAGGRRWAWRREGGGAVAGAAAGATAFQRARLASASRPESPLGDAVGAEASGQSVSSGRPSSSLELNSRRTTSEDAAGAAGAAHAQDGAAGPGVSQFQQSSAGLPPFSNGVEGGAGAAGGPAAAAGGYQQQYRSVSGLARLRPAISLLSGESAALPSPRELAGGAAYTPKSLVVESVLSELRTLAALESAVYLAGGRKTFAGGSYCLHTPARRLARTIISLGPHEGLAVGLQAIRAIQASAGAASGDMHRLSFWWSNVLQLRWMFWSLCHGYGLCDPSSSADMAAAAGGAAASQGRPPSQRGSRLDEAFEQRASEELSPRAALAGGGRRSSTGGSQSWMQALVPQLRELESWLFAEMLKHLWWRVLLQAVMARQVPSSGAGSPAASAGAQAAAAGAAFGEERVVRSAKSAPQLRPSSGGSGEQQQTTPTSLQGTPRCFESPEEEAVERWVRGLRGVERALGAAGRPAPAPRPHLSLLHRQLIVALLRRLDTLLFRKLLSDDADSPRHAAMNLHGLSGRGAFDRAAADGDAALGIGGADAAAVGLLDQSVLPFQRGPLTFSTGVALKMAVSRLTGWAADCGVKEDRLPQAARSTEMSDYRLFPCLRATADLLMMPKEVLTDREMRREVVPGLPLHRICQLLERFEADDVAPDPLPPGLLETLQSESPRSDGGSTPSPTSKEEEEYLAPAEAGLLADGIIEPLSLEMGEESEDELDVLSTSRGGLGGAQPSPSSSNPMLASAAAVGGAEEMRASRFLLLRDLWAIAG